MDALDHLFGPATDLLRRVDELLAEDGAPDGHRIWPLLRRMRTLPGAAAEAVAALHPEPVTTAAAELRALVEAYGEAGATLMAEVEWEGGAAGAFATRRNALAAHLDGGSESLAGRLAESVSFLDAVADWMSAGRAALVRTLAEVLGSAEAVAILLGPRAASTAGPTDEFGAVATVALTAPAAAAEIGARVLTTVADIHDRGEVLRQQGSPKLTKIATFRPPSVAARLDSTTRMAF
ncbi:MAG TPA: hypothetical protein VFX60_05720 [Micromonospora sp.]|nr:hypothetical protein [Micromonospora sp.]